jgi:anti-sigma-K factor RskA
MSEEEKIARLELLDRYYQGEMEAEEARQFEARLDQEPELAQELALLSAWAEGIRQQQSEPLSEEEESRLAALVQQEANRPPPSSPGSPSAPKAPLEDSTLDPPPALWKRYRWALAAAALALLLAWLFWPVADPAPEQQLALYQQQVFQRSSDLGSESDSLLNAARLAFDQQDWEQSISLYEQLLAADSSNQVLIQDLASAYFWADQKEKALRILGKGPPEDRQFKWARAVLLLSFDSQDMRDQAEPLLRALAAGDPQKVLTQKARAALELYF